MILDEQEETYCPACGDLMEFLGTHGSFTLEAMICIDVDMYVCPEHHHVWLNVGPPDFALDVAESS